MSTRIAFFFFAALTLTAFESYSQVQPQPDPDDLLRKIDEKFSFGSGEFTAEIETDAGGKKRTSKIKLFSRDAGEGESYTFIRYLDPAEDKGTGFLLIKDINNMWMYLPKVGKVVRIPSSTVKQSMMGSDFSYEEMMKPHKLSEDYSAKLAAEEKMGGDETYKLDLAAKTGKAAYKSLKLWARKSDLMPVRMEFFGGDGRLLKDQELSEFKDMNGKVIPTKIKMSDREKGNHSTLVTVLEAKHGIEVPDKYFTLHYLEKGM